MQLTCTGDQRKTWTCQQVGSLPFINGAEVMETWEIQNSQCRCNKGFRKGKPPSFTSFSESESTLGKISQWLILQMKSKAFCLKWFQHLFSGFIYLCSECPGDPHRYIVFQLVMWSAFPIMKEVINREEGWTGGFPFLLYTFCQQIFFEHYFMLGTVLGIWNRVHSCS